jgi:hypothetical protein
LDQHRNDATARRQGSPDFHANYVARLLKAALSFFVGSVGPTLAHDEQENVRLLNLFDDRSAEVHTWRDRGYILEDVPSAQGPFKVIEQPSRLGFRITSSVGNEYFGHVDLSAPISTFNVESIRLAAADDIGALPVTCGGIWDGVKRCARLSPQSGKKIPGAISWSGHLKLIIPSI